MNSLLLATKRRRVSERQLMALMALLGIAKVFISTHDCALDNEK